MTRYYVTTWDCEKGEFTPQAGVRKGPCSHWGLRRALRKLREMGYEARRGDSSVLVESDGTIPPNAPSHAAVRAKEQRIARCAAERYDISHGLVDRAIVLKMEPVT